MPEWVVVLLALAAAVTSALGIVIRQRATLEIPQDEGVSTTMFKKLLRNRLWWAGTAVAASGYGFQALALTWGSLILVAPLLVSALLFALPMSARLAHRRVTTHDWVWALVLTFGLATFLTVARVQPGNYRPPPAVWVLATVLCMTVVLACVVGGARSRGPQPRAADRHRGRRVVRRGGGAHQGHRAAPQRGRPVGHARSSPRHISSSSSA